MSETRDLIIKMSEGNPGAIQVVISLLEEVNKNSSNVKYLLLLNKEKLYGSKLYMLWNDCCDRDIIKVMKALDGVFKEEYTFDFVREQIELSFDSYAWR